MGNTINKIIRDNSSIQMDEIVSAYVLLMKPSDFKRWKDIDQCNQYIELVAKLIKERFESEILPVSSRMKLKDQTEIGIAIFYIKWIHLVSSIQSTQIKEEDNITQFCGSQLFELFYGKQLPELDTLYDDSDYDYRTGEFKGRSKEMSKVYNEDLTTFYAAFTGTQPLNPIPRFSDIIINTYNKSRQPSVNSNNLFEQYATTMVDNLVYIKTAQDRLDRVICRQDHTCLTESKLNELIHMVRPILLELYMTCEDNYRKGLQIYEAIVNKKWLDVLHHQVVHLNKHKIELTTM